MSLGLPSYTSKHKNISSNLVNISGFLEEVSSHSVGKQEMSINLLLSEGTGPTRLTTSTTCYHYLITSILCNRYFPKLTVKYSSRNNFSLTTPLNISYLYNSSKCFGIFLSSLLKVAFYLNGLYFNLFKPM